MEHFLTEAKKEDSIMRQTGGNSPLLSCWEREGWSFEHLLLSTVETPYGTMEEDNLLILYVLERREAWSAVPVLFMCGVDDVQVSCRLLW